MADAQQRLGMVSPTEVVYVNAPPSPVGATDLPAGNDATGTSSAFGSHRRLAAREG